jgi:hypothetical protein
MGPGNGFVFAVHTDVRIRHTIHAKLNEPGRVIVVSAYQSPHTLLTDKANFEQ